MFKCNNCGRDTLTQPHRINCTVLKEQSKLLCEQLGIPFRPENYQLPLHLEGS